MHAVRRPPRLVKRPMVACAVGLSLCFVLGLGSGFWIHRTGTHWPVVRWLEQHSTPAYVARWVSAHLTAAEVQTLRIDIKFNEMQKLRTIRQRAFENGVLLGLENEYVGADLRFEGRIMPAKLRLKGDMAPHWTGDKWSLRIKLSGDHQIKGMRRFSVQHPRQRRYLYEWGYMETLKREDLLALRYDLIRVVLNGREMGLYGVEEHFSAEAMEANHRREGIFVKPDESDFWNEYARLGAGYDFKNMANRGLMQARLDTFRSKHVSADPQLSVQRDRALALLRGFVERKLAPEEVFDAELMGRYMAVAELWGAPHDIHWRNVRFYYNPLTARLEPVGYDASPLRDPTSKLIWGAELWQRHVLRSVPIAEAYIRNLQRMIEPGYVETLKEEFGPSLARKLNVLCREFAFDEDLELPWEMLTARRDHIRKLLAVSRMVLAFSDSATAGTSPGVIEIRNNLPLAVEVVGIQVGEEPLVAGHALWQRETADVAVSLARQAVCLPASFRQDQPLYAHFRLPGATSRAPRLVGHAEGAAASGRTTAPIYVYTRIVGHDRTVRTVVLQQSAVLDHRRVLEPAGIDDVLAQHQFLKYRPEQSELWIPPGEWLVDQDLIVPNGLRLCAGPGTVMKFKSDALLLAHSAVEFSATAEQPLILEAQSTDWPGLVVMQAPQRSRLEHVIIRNTRRIDRQGWMLTGGVTFYKSPVVINHCVFEDSRAEDALNIIRSRFELADSLFRRCRSDAFDGDFVNGSVHDCHFEDVGGDGIDVSGSEVQIQRALFESLGDKALSVGEQSTVKAQTISVSNSRFGLVSKDASQLNAGQVRLQQVDIGLASFVKKKHYGPATLVAHNIQGSQITTCFMLQTGCSMSVDGVAIEPAAVDVDALYQRSDRVP